MAQHSSSSSSSSSSAPPHLDEEWQLASSIVALNTFQEKMAPFSPLVLDYCAMLCFSFELIASLLTARNVLQDDLKLVLNLGTGMSQPVSRKITKMLRDFRSVGSPIEESFRHSFDKIGDHHRLLLQKLKAKMDEKEEELNSLRMCYKISFIMLGALEASLIICAVVAIATSLAPKIAGVLAILTAVPIMFVGDWIKSHKNRQMRRIEVDKNIFKKMQLHTDILNKEFKLLCMPTLGLEKCLEDIASTIGLAGHIDRDAVALIKKKRRDFVDGLDSLQAFATRCETCINSAVELDLLL